MRRTAVALWALVLLGLARGEETAEEAKARKVRELVELNGFLDSVAGVPPSAIPDRARKQLLDVVIPKYGKKFDDETLDAALAFFRSDAGKKYVVSARMGAASAVPAVRTAETEKKIDQSLVAVRKCKEYYDQAQTWRVIRGKPPASLDEMEGPVVEGDKSNFTKVDEDPWGHKYVLRIEDTKPRVVSFGPDGTEGTGDDIVYPAR
jgi:hypothetical protein